MIEPLGERLAGYFHFFGLKGSLLLQLGRGAEAGAAFDQAISLATSPAQAAHIRQHLDQLKEGWRCRAELVAALSEPVMPGRPLGERTGGKPMAASAPEKAVRQAIAARNAALGAKDVAAVMASGAAGFVSYNLAPPLKAAAGKEGLKGWFETWDGPIGCEVRD